MPRQHRHNPPRRAGFSIIELMVVVAIILILVGIGVVGISQFNAAAEQDVCREIMATALAAMTEYQAQTRGQIPGGDADTSGGDVEEFVTDIKLFDDAETHLDKLASNGYYVGTTIVDPWGSALKYYTQNIDADASGGPDNNANLKAYSKPFFVSAGPDGDFDTDEDNVYSFEIVN